MCFFFFFTFGQKERICLNSESAKINPFLYLRYKKGFISFSDQSWRGIFEYWNRFSDLVKLRFKPKYLKGLEFVLLL